MSAPARKTQPPPRSSGVGSATLEELLAIPEEERRHELIQGTIVPTKEAARGEHGLAQWALSGWLAPFGRRPGGRFPGGWWFATEVEVYFDERNTLRPDITGWRRAICPEPPTGTPIRAIPDWVCEILSTNRGYDLIKKKRVYQRHQVSHYWIIDPIAQSLSVLRWTPDGYLHVLDVERGETVHAEPFVELPFSLGLVFGDEPAEELGDVKDDSSDKPE